MKARILNHPMTPATRPSALHQRAAETQLFNTVTSDLHLLFDKHFTEQVGRVDEVAERIQILGGIAVAMSGSDPDLRYHASDGSGRRAERLLKVLQ